MKSLFCALVAVISILGSEAVASVYQYTGLNYDQFQGATYNASMRVTGNVVTSAPLPANATGFDARGIVVSWSFSDGVKTLDNNNAVLLACCFLFDTDASGNITQVDILAARAPLSTVIGQTDDLIWLTGPAPFDEGTENVPCMTLSAGMCSDWNFSAGGWTAGWVDAIGTWTTTTTTTSPQMVPTMPVAAALLLIVLLMVVAIVWLRRSNGP